MNDRMKLPDVRSKRVKNTWHSQAQAGLAIISCKKMIFMKDLKILKMYFEEDYFLIICCIGLR